MKKIPTLFVRDPDNRAHVLPEVHPDCQWVIDGEGVATRKYDGTCVGFFPAIKGEVRIHGGIVSGDVNEACDVSGVWMARREVKPGKNPPPGFIAEQTDETTGKTVGWEPIGQSSFAKFHAEALELLSDPYFGTYELCGPKINGNPEGFNGHTLTRHYTAARLHDAPRDFDGLRGYLPYRRYEGIVWHHPDGRMAKLKARDFPTSGSAS